MLLLDFDVDGLFELRPIFDPLGFFDAVVKRRQAVALLKAQGKSNRQIAEELDIGIGTVSRDINDPNGSKTIQMDHWNHR